MLERALIPTVALLASAPAAFSVVTQVIMYDLNIRTNGGFANMGGTDYVSTTVNTTGAIVGPGTGGERIEWTGNTTTLSVPTAPGLTSVNMSVAGSNTPEIGSTTGGGAGQPGAGITGELANAETMTFTFDQAVAITEIDAQWWDGEDQLAITMNGMTYNNPQGPNRNNPINFGAGGVFPTTAFTDPVSGNSVTGVALAAGSPITFSVWDADGNGSLNGNGLVQGSKFAVVPEPSRVTLLVGALGIFLLRRRR